MSMHTTRNTIVAVLLGLLALAPIASAHISGGDVYKYATGKLDCSPGGYNEYNACALITNDTSTITAPGVVKPASLHFLDVAGRVCEDIQDVTDVIPANTNDIAIAHTGSTSTQCADGVFFYELDPQDYTGRFPVLASVRAMITRDGFGSESYSTCVKQPYVWCEMTKDKITKAPPTVHSSFRLTTRPLLVHVVNKTPNPIKRIPFGMVTRGLWRSLIGDNAYGAIAPGGSAWMGGLRKTGATECPLDPATGKEEADCVATEVSRSVIGATFAIEPASGPLANDYSGGQIPFTITTRTDGIHSSTCTPQYRPTLAPMTCKVEFGGANDGVMTATVTIFAAS